MRPIAFDQSEEEMTERTNTETKWNILLQI